MAYLRPLNSNKYRLHDTHNRRDLSQVYQVSTFLLFGGGGESTRRVLCISSHCSYDNEDPTSDNFSLRILLFALSAICPRRSAYFIECTITQLRNNHGVHIRWMLDENRTK